MVNSAPPPPCDLLVSRAGAKLPADSNGISEAAMGLLDILGGLAGGQQQGQGGPFGTQTGGQGLSPIAIALISLLAGKSGGGSGGMGGGLGDILGTVLG